MEAVQKSINEMHTDTRILINIIESRLIKDKQDFISYDEMSASISRDVQHAARGLMTTARKHIEQEHNVLLETVNNQGIKLTHDFIGKADQQIKHVGKTTRKEMKRIVNATVNENIPNSEMIKLNARMSQLGAFAVMAKPSATKKLESGVEKNMAKELPTAETFRLFER